MRKKIILLIGIAFCHRAVAQTLQQVTDNGATTNKIITAKSFTAGGSSYAGSALPNNIFSLSGIQLNGDIPDASHNAITYQSGGGGGAAVSFYRGGGYDTGIDFYTNYNTAIHGNLNHALRINGLGQLGLGTSFPRSYFDVGRHLNNGQLGSVFGRLFEGDTNGEGTFLGVRGLTTSVIDGKSFSLVHAFYGLPNSSINFHRGQSSTGGFISFSTHSDVERMRIDDLGNVGIGTPSPKEKLSVNGKVRAHEVKVETANWPDYVFEEGYKHKTLEEIENFIKANKHLPEVPSAEQVEKDGVELGEMNKILLKKIEELTLLLIDLKKENTEMNGRLGLLEKDVKKNKIH